MTEVKNKHQYKKKDSLSAKRRVFAWCLLLVFCLQRIVGILGEQLVYVLEIETVMDGSEQSIAEKIQAETGIAVQIEIQDERQLELLQTLGYSAPFIFQEEVDGKVIYYTVNYAVSSSENYVFAKMPASDPLQNTAAGKSISDRLLSKFFFWNSHFSIKKQIAFKVPGTTVPYLGDDYFTTIPSPPPKVA